MTHLIGRGASWHSQRELFVLHAYTLLHSVCAPSSETFSITNTQLMTEGRGDLYHEHLLCTAGTRNLSWRSQSLPYI